MAKPILDDEVWGWIAPLLPIKPRRARFAGRKPLDNRKALTGILVVLKLGIPWHELPQELGCGSGMSCWRRLHAWQHAGVWPHVQALLSHTLPDAKKINWSRVQGDGLVSAPSVKGEC